MNNYGACDLFAELKAQRRAKAWKTAGALMFAIAALRVTRAGASNAIGYAFLMTNKKERTVKSKTTKKAGYAPVVKWQKRTRAFGKVT